jgi:hypothetical protein
VLRTSARSDAASFTDQLVLEFNGSGATNYSYTNINGSSTRSGSVRGTVGRVGYINSGNSTANTFGILEAYIPSYLVSQNKPFSGFGVSENNSGSANEAFVTAYATLWRNTSAITSITISVTNGPNFVQYSSFYLYGISNA